MDGRAADTDAPDLGIGMACQQALGGCQGVFGHLEGSAVHVKGHHLAVIAGLHLGAHVLLVKSRAAAGVLFFAVARAGVWSCRFSHLREEVCVSSIVAVGAVTCSEGRTTDSADGPRGVRGAHRGTAAQSSYRSSSRGWGLTFIVTSSADGSATLAMRRRLFLCCRASSRCPIPKQTTPLPATAGSAHGNACRSSSPKAGPFGSSRNSR